eukprot:scaffold36490_cov61-Phaeocystis_antarctica.AAC.6
MSEVRTTRYQHRYRRDAALCCWLLIPHFAPCWRCFAIDGEACSPQTQPRIVPPTPPRHRPRRLGPATPAAMRTALLTILRRVAIGAAVAGVLGVLWALKAHAGTVLTLLATQVHSAGAWGVAAYVAAFAALPHPSPHPSRPSPSPHPSLSPSPSPSPKSHLAAPTPALALALTRPPLPVLDGAGRVRRRQAAYREAPPQQASAFSSAASSARVSPAVHLHAQGRVAVLHRAARRAQHRVGHGAVRGDARLGRGVDAPQAGELT